MSKKPYNPAQEGIDAAIEDAAKQNQGTPKTLDEAIKLGLCVGPLSEVVDRSYFQIKDFLSQRFGVAMLLASDPNVEETLKILFEEITRRE